MAESLFGFDPERAWDHENGFYLTSDVSRIGKLLAHFELYRSIVELPGHVVECGVYKGASLIRFATFRDLLESPRSRRIIGFDAFGRFPDPGEAQGAAFVARFEKAGGDGIAAEDLERVLARKRLGDVELVPGDVRETVPAYARGHPELKIALLHLDLDVHGPSRAVLDALLDRIVPGGLLVADDYGTVEGATRAVDEALAGRGLAVRKLPIAHVPAFVRIPEARG